MQDLTGRVAQIQDEMRLAGLEAVVLRLAENVLLATGWFVRAPGGAFAIIPPEGSCVLVVPDYEAEEAAQAWGGEIAPLPTLGADAGSLERTLGAVASKIDATGGAIGFEGSFETLGLPSFFGEPNAVAAPTQNLLRASFGTERLVDVTEALERIRAIKTPRELELIRRTNDIAMLGLDAFKRAAVPGATEVEVMAAVEHAITVEGHGHGGARWVRGFATVASGPALAESGWQFFRGSTRTIERDDTVMIELGTVADGYWSDHTRTVVAGTPPSIVADAYEAVQDAYRRTLAAARPGVVANDLDVTARAACREHGFVEFPHHTGHGVGFRYHEFNPMIASGSTHGIAEHQVIAIEPGIYDPALNIGVRHEDNVTVTKDGGVTLSTTSYGLGLD